MVNRIHKNHFIEKIRHTLLRGGFLTKVCGRVAGYAPDNGGDGDTQCTDVNRPGLVGSSLSFGAIGAALLASVPFLLMAETAQAGSCSEAADVWTCTGAADGAGNDALIVINDTTAGLPVSVGNDGTFGNNSTNVAGVGLAMIFGAGTGDVMIDLIDADITGQMFGVIATNSGVGDIFLLTNGQISAVSSTALVVNGVVGSADLTLKTGAGLINGNQHGVTVSASGTGVTVVEIGAGGILAGATGTGLSVQTAAASTGLAITTIGAISAGLHGIGVSNFGAGALPATILTGAGAIIATTGDGIHVLNVAGSGDFNITTGIGPISGGNDGIDFKNNGAGNVTITTGVGDVTGNGMGSHSGINAIGDATSTGNIEITTNSGNVLGEFGIISSNEGSGDLTITTNGNVEGTSGVGLLGHVYGGNLSVDVISGEVKGTTNGIYTNNHGVGTVQINVSGTVTGGTGLAIATYSDPTSGLTTINLNAGAIVSAASGSIQNDEGDSRVNVLAGATLIGNVYLGAGSDTLIFNGADITQFGVLNGGGDTSNADFLVFGSTTGSLVGADLQNWDYIRLANNSNISFSDNAVSAGVAVNVDLSSTLNASGGLAIAGGLSLSGTSTITLVDGTAGDVLSVSTVYVGQGSILLDVDYTNDVADNLVLNNVQPSATTITLNDITTGAITGNDILLVDVTGATDATDFALAGGPVVMGLYEYDLALVGSQWLLQGGITAAAAPYEASASVLLGMADMSSYAQRTGQREQLAGQALWGRIGGDFAKYTPTSSFTDYSVISRSFDVETGVDFLVNSDVQGDLMLGLNVSYGVLGADISTPSSAASINAKGVGIGATATWVGTDGLYADLQGGVDWIFSDFASDADGALVNGHRSTLYSASFEVGSRLNMGAGATIIPQAQLSWSHLIGGTFTDSTAAANVVDLGNNERLVARIGLAYEVELEKDQTLYAIGNLLHDFSSTNNVVAAATDLTSVGAATWAEVGVGGSFALDSNITVYGEVSAKTSLGGNMGGNYALSATGGVHVIW